MPCVGGSLTASAAGSVALQNIARWDGSSWSDVLGGVSGTGVTVHALAVFDDGSGAALYIAGRFTAAGGSHATNIARWNGVSWSSVGGGLQGQVLSPAVFDDGVSSKLYAGRGVGSSSFLRAWDGASCSDITDAPNAPVHALAARDLGAGERLFAGSDFTATLARKHGDLRRTSRSSRSSPPSQGCVNATGPELSTTSVRRSSSENAKADRSRFGHA